MAMDVGGGKGGLKSDINVTPLVDVMLVLLIIMMIVAPMLQQGVAVTLPVAENTVDKPDDQNNTVVAITADKRIWVNGVQVRPDDLTQRVTEAMETKTERILIIMADEDVDYGTVMETMDALTAAGIEDMGLIAERRVTAGGN